MTRLEFKVWLVFLVPIGSAALLAWLLPNDLILLSLFILVGALLLLAVPLFIYLLLAFGLNLLIARWHPVTRILATVSGMALVAVGVPWLLNIPENNVLAGLKAADHPATQSVPTQNLAIIVSDDDTGGPDFGYCNALCMALLTEHRVSHVDYATRPEHRPLRFSDRFPADVAVTRYALEARKDCPNPHSRFYSGPTNIDKYFAETGACVISSVGNLSDDDIVVVKAAIPDKLLKSDKGSIRHDLVYRQTTQGHELIGRQSYYSLLRIANIWIPSRPVEMSGGTSGHLTVVTSYDTRQRSRDDMTWLQTDLGIKLLPARQAKSVH